MSENFPTAPDAGVPSPASTERRKAALAQAVSREVASSGWRVESQSDYQAVLAKGKNTSHVLHLILTLITFGLWGFVWIIVAFVNARQTLILTVDEYANVRSER